THASLTTGSEVPRRVRYDEYVCNAVEFRGALLTLESSPPALVLAFPVPLRSITLRTTRYGPRPISFDRDAERTAGRPTQRIFWGRRCRLLRRRLDADGQRDQPHRGRRRQCLHLGQQL